MSDFEKVALHYLQEMADTQKEMLHHLYEMNKKLGQARAVGDAELLSVWAGIPAEHRADALAVLKAFAARGTKAPA